MNTRQPFRYYEGLVDPADQPTGEFFAGLQAGMRYRACWQCGHLESAHTVEDRGCTEPSCSCAQVPEA